MKIHRIDLNKYESVKETDPNVSLAITPAGGDLPTMYFKHIKPLGLITEVNQTIVWSKDNRIDIFASQEEYNKMVTWWFVNIPESVNDELLELSSKAIELGWDLKRSIDKAEIRLKNVPIEKRKSYLYKYLLNWVSRGVTYWIEKNKRIYE